MPRTYIALDLEFTGLDPDRDEIIEIALVKFQGHQVVESFASLVNTQRPIPLKVQQLVGISQLEIGRAPTLRALSGRILSFIGSLPLVAHTIAMDLRFLRRHGLDLNNLAIDTFELATILVPEVQRYSLSNLAEFLGIPLEQSHRALADALATKDLFLALLERLERWELPLLEEVVTLAEKSAWPLRHLFREVLQERRERQAGSFFRAKEARSWRLPLAAPEEDFPPLRPAETVTPVDAQALAAMISPGGAIAKAFPGYEYREQQIEMLKAVAEAFNRPHHLLVEAGTGTGKSLAYLLPAIYFAVQNGRRVVVSSNTINLQDQLYNKDLPDLQRLLPVGFHVALLKGRSNYLCLRRLALFRRSQQLSEDQVRVLAKILAWLPFTKTGDRVELVLLNEENAVWADVQADAQTCLGDRCPYRQEGSCFFYRARARAERAHLVIINHALLLSDLVLENRILPEYKHLIIDEAHHLEDQATAQFGFEVGRRELYAFLVGLSFEGGDMPGGLLAKVPAIFQHPQCSPTAQQALTALIQSLRTEVDTAQRRLYELFNGLEGFLANHVDKNTNLAEGYDQHIPLTSGLRTQPDWSAVEIAWENFAAPLRQVLRGLERLASQINALDLGEDAARDELVQEIEAQRQRGQEMWANMDKILMQPDAQGIYWISVSRREQEITLCSAPLHVGPLLRERLFAQVDTLVLTSATLRTGQDFHFIQQRLGLEDPVTLALDSPFDFRSAVLLYVPKDIPEPSEPYYQKTVERALIDLCRATEGRTLVLFTANSQLNATYRAIQGPLEQEGIIVLGQGFDGSRRQILDSFRTTPKAVLLGTRSFWEGVDVVGQALSCLVITRLPFAVPTDPVLSARAETFEDPFNEYYLPDSILRFRQGFGRLIRSKTDYGLVVVLDKRLLTKPYGKLILRSLPPCTARQGPLEALPSLARRWLDPQTRAELEVPAKG
jgi:predicted DnaQ family exonuclease/DinG family helicase